MSRFIQSVGSCVVFLVITGTGPQELSSSGTWRRQSMGFRLQSVQFSHPQRFKRFVHNALDMGLESSRSLDLQIV